MEALKKKRPKPKLLVLSSLCVAALALYGLARIPVFSEYVFARGLTRWLSFILGRLTNYIPVSFYELTAVFLIVGGAALAAHLIALLCKKNFARAVLWIYRLAVAALSVLLAFGALYAPLYGRQSAAEALGLADTEVTEAKLYDAAAFYVKELNATSAAMERGGEGNVRPSYGFGELADRLNAEFSALGGGYFAECEVRPKAVLLSVPMSYLGITGIYFPFYAEANVNVNIPPYELPVTMAHEMAHAKGVSRENEANIVAYALCIRSGDDYLRYSGLMNAAAVLLNALPEESRKELRGELDEEILAEYAAANEHYAKYDGWIDGISSFFNDLFLKSNGVPGGTRSYGETAESLVALYEQLA